MPGISRRALLGGAGQLAALGTFATAMPQQLLAADEDESNILLTILYPGFGGKAKFDARRYRESHIPLLKSVYGNSIERIEMRTPRKMPGFGGNSRPGSGSHVPKEAPAGPPQAVLAAATVWIRDLKAFGEKTPSVQQQLMDDLKDTTDSVPIIQYDRVAAVLGDGHNDVGLETQVLSTYFRHAEGGKFDAKYYGEKVIPLMVKLYTSKAIRRIQYNLAIKQGDAAPMLTAAAHFYIRDRAAWDAAGMQAFPQLAAESPKYTTLTPVVTDMEVTGVA